MLSDFRFLGIEICVAQFWCEECWCADSLGQFEIVIEVSSISFRDVLLNLAVRFDQPDPRGNVTGFGVEQSTGFVQHDDRRVHDRDPGTVAHEQGHNFGDHHSKATKCDATGCTYLNTAAFARVPVSTVTNATVRSGNYKVGQVRGPASWTLNATLARNFAIAAGRRLQVRADAFNVLNQRNLDNPVLNITSSDFGRISSAGTARTIQVGARLSF